MMSSCSFCMSEKNLFPFVLRSYFCWVQNSRLTGFVFVLNFSTVKMMMLHYLLTYIVSNEKSTVTLIFVPLYLMSFFYGWF